MSSLSSNEDDVTSSKVSVDPFKEKGEGFLEDPIDLGEAPPPTPPRTPPAAVVPNVVFLAVHGIGASDTYIQECRSALDRAIRKLRKYWFWELDFTYQLEFVDWKSELSPLQQNCFERLLCEPTTVRKEAVASSGEAATSPVSAFWDLLSGVGKRSVSRADNDENIASLAVESAASSSFDMLGKRSFDRTMPILDVLTGRTFPTGASDLTNPKKLMCNNVSDLLSFMTPTIGDRIVRSVAEKLNAVAARLDSGSRICLIGHSLGSVILYELLAGVALRPSEFSPEE